MAFLQQRGNLRDDLRHPCRVGRFAFDDEVISLRANVNVEQRFEVTEVFVVGPKEGLDGGLGNRDLPQRSRLDSRISLYFSYLPAPK